MGSKRGGKRKYTLFSAANGAVATCAFFNSPEGCRNGSACAFKHASNADGQDAAVDVKRAAPTAPAVAAAPAAPSPVPPPPPAPKPHAPAPVQMKCDDLRRSFLRPYRTRHVQSFETARERVAGCARAC